MGRESERSVVNIRNTAYIHDIFKELINVVFKCICFLSYWREMELQAHMHTSIYICFFKALSMAGTLTVLLGCETLLVVM